MKLRHKDMKMAGWVSKLGSLYAALLYRATIVIYIDGIRHSSAVVMEVL